MSNTAHYGGWVTGRPLATGGTSSFVRNIGWMAAAGVAAGVLGTGGELSFDNLQRELRKCLQIAPTVAIADTAPVRTPAQDLARIREVLRPAVSDLATTLNVSRQSVYNWLNGEPVADENAAKLRSLAHAADVLAHEGVTVNAALLKRKFANGRTLLQVAQAGESARDAALQLVQLYKREAAQRERMMTRLVHRPKSPPSADFDFPSSNDLA